MSFLEEISWFLWEFTLGSISWNLPKSLIFPSWLLISCFIFRERVWSLMRIARGRRNLWNPRSWIDQIPSGLVSYWSWRPTLETLFLFGLSHFPAIKPFVRGLAHRIHANVAIWCEKTGSLLEAPTGLFSALEWSWGNLLVFFLAEEILGNCWRFPCKLVQKKSWVISDRPQLVVAGILNTSARKFS